MGDEAAVVFSSSFYRGIAYGSSVRRAFDQAIAALMLDGIPEEDTPELIYRPDIDPGNLILVGLGRGANLETTGIELVDIGLVDNDRYHMEKKDGGLDSAPKGLPT